LSEDDIRNRLYGSAVGIAPDLHDKPLPKKKKEPEVHPEPFTQNTNNTEGERIRHDLESLRQELEQTRRKLKRMHGVKAKKMRLMLVSSVVFIVIILFTIAAVRFIFRPRAKSTQRVKAPVANARVAASSTYTIQVAVSADSADADRYTANLQSKGYKAFIHKSKYKSGKDKFIIYVGGFKSAKSAEGVLNRLKDKEGIADSFVTSMPK